MPAKDEHAAAAAAAAAAAGGGGGGGGLSQPHHSRVDIRLPCTRGDIRSIGTNSVSIALWVQRLQPFMCEQQRSPLIGSGHAQTHCSGCFLVPTAR
jgi:hypothetical protein